VTEGLGDQCFQRPGCRENREEKIFALSVRGRQRHEDFSKYLFSNTKHYTYSCSLSVVPRQGTGLHYIFKYIVSRPEKRLPMKGVFYTSEAYFTDIKAYKYNSLLGVERQGQCCSSKTRYSLLFPLVHSLSPLSRDAPHCLSTALPVSSPCCLI
jgi:hypothetical protein